MTPQIFTNGRRWRFAGSSGAAPAVTKACAAASGVPERMSASPTRAASYPSARQRATHDLRIADNTFETVEASYQLRNLMKDAAASFEALQRLEAPTFDQIFKNEELRREFENLTRKLDAPSS